MRRCKDLVHVARKYIAYRIFVRNLSAHGATWANARSVIRLQTLGIRGPHKGEALPVVEVRVGGFRPRMVMREIRKVLEGESDKYLSVYELYEIAEKTGGKIIVKPPESIAFDHRSEL
jgi:phosphotransferase system HPr-like phosphotransfer protein